MFPAVSVASISRTFWEFMDGGVNDCEKLYAVPFPGNFCITAPFQRIETLVIGCAPATLPETLTPLVIKVPAEGDVIVTRGGGDVDGLAVWIVDPVPGRL